VTPAPTHIALLDVGIERARQDEKWGSQSGNHDFEWMSILAEEIGEAAQATNEANFKSGSTPGDFTQLRAELVQVAAVAVAWIEAIDGRA
jgi:NTP pyrophosphatase (non-canonical NTP hydrolase)